MNSNFISDLRAKNPMFQKITEHLLSHTDVRNLTLPEMVKITGAPFEDVNQMCQFIGRKAGIGRYVIGRKGNPNRFMFEHYPQDIAFAAIDGMHTADKIPKVVQTRNRPIVNDAGKVVAVTNTREKHISVSLDEKGYHIDISPGVNVSAETLLAVMNQLN